MLLVNPFVVLQLFFFDVRPFTWVTHSVTRTPGIGHHGAWNFESNVVGKLFCGRMGNSTNAVLSNMANVHILNANMSPDDHSSLSHVFAMVTPRGIWHTIKGGAGEKRNLGKKGLRRQPVPISHREMRPGLHNAMRPNSPHE